MPFKIVQTIEKGEIVLTCVPHQWESSGVLYWPRKQKQSLTRKLQKDEGSQPDDTWAQINCAVKRRNIKTYQDAINEIDIMSNKSETETEIEDVSAKKRRMCSDVPQLSYNIMAEEIVQADYEITTPSPAELTPSETLMSASQENVEKYVVIPESNQSDTPMLYSYINKEISLSEEQCEIKSIKTDINNIKSDLKSINDDMKTIMEVLNTSLNNQGVIDNTLKSILYQVTSLKVMNEEFIKKSITEKQTHSLVLNQIKDLKDLEEFEKKLIDSQYRDDLEKKLSVLCTKGTGQGTTSSYTIVDILFERQFFKLCSWTGATRSSENDPAEKICFKSFSKTIGFFFEIIHKMDSSFNLTDCHKFFKTILRNAEQRCKIEPKRASTKKCRGKKGVKKTSSESRVTNETPSDNKTSSENLATNETPPKQPFVDKQTAGNQRELDNVTEEIFV
ncbi:hypothetical protein evm_013639 [Chilo suppressalis]|nr:hypothetical protein evm_013639 [Chilo suppressalis]